MRLGELIERLEKADQNKVLPIGFHSPHSYRGYYDRLAFELTENISVRAVLNFAKEAVGTTYTGYKGGEFKMDKHTEVYIANYGDCGEEIGHLLLSFMLGEIGN